MVYKINWRTPHAVLFILRLSVAGIFINSALQKLMSGNFPDTLARVLGYFISANPNGWYVSFIQNFILPQSFFWGWVIQLGELAVGFSLMLGLLFPLGLLGLFLLAVNFLLAAGWTSPATFGLNFLLVVLSLVFWLILPYDKWRLDKLILKFLSHEKN